MHQNDTGTLLTATIKDGSTAVDISDATSKYLYVKKPSGTVDTHTPYFTDDGADGQLSYKTDDDDLDETGEYNIQAKAITPTKTWYSGVQELWVHESLDGDAEDDEDMASPFLNIENYGGVPYTTDASFDNGPIINAMLARMEDDLFGGIYLPGRAYGIKTTIAIPNTLQSLRMVGNGSWKYSGQADGYYKGVPSQLLWTGSNGGTMMTVASHGLTLDGIAFTGYATASGDTQTLSAINNAGIGLQMAYTSSMNPSMMHLKDCSFSLCDVGLQFGGAISGACDQSIVDGVNIYNCGVGIYVSSTQSVGINCRRLFAMHTPTVLDLRGGSFYLDGCEITSTWTKFANIQLSATRGYYAFNNVRVDNLCHNVVIIDASSNALDGRCVITMDNLWHSGTAPTNPTIKLAGLAMLNLKNALYLPEDLIVCDGASTRRVRVTLRDSMMAAASAENLVDEADSSPEWTYEWSGCYNNYGQTGTMTDGSTGED